MAGDVVGVGVGVVPVPPSQGGRRGHRQKAAWLPLDIIITEIAARSDPATLVRCAATCRDARRRLVEDPDLGGRLRLRDTERFVPPLLLGHMTGIETYTGGGGGAFMPRSRTGTDVYLMDAVATTAADSTRLVKETFVSSGAQAEKLSSVVTMDSRRGLVFVCATVKTQINSSHHRQLFVWNPATRRRLVLPSEPSFPEDDDEDPVAGRRSADVEYVLLVGEGRGAGADVGVGRPFQVLKVKLVLSEKYRCQRRLLLHTFSSEQGAWSPRTEIPTPNLHGSDRSPSPLQRMPLVIGDVVHWLCLTGSGSYMLMLNVRAARVNVTALPASFPRDGVENKHQYPYSYDRRRYHYLLATATAGGNPIVLVADADRISAWELKKSTKTWKPQPKVVIENETLRRFRRNKCVPRLELFGEKSGALLLRIADSCLLWLDLHTMKVHRCFSLGRLLHAQVYCPCEMDLSSWVPTFNSDVISFD